MERQMCVLRCLFLLNSLSSSTWGRFGQIYYLGKGLSKAEIGLIEGMMPVVRVCSQSWWAVLADKRGLKKQIYLFTTVSGTCVLLVLGTPLVRNSFWRILSVSLGSCAFSSAGILDAYALQVVGPENAKKSYGRLRLWGSVGWGSGALAMGAINDAYGFGPNFVLYGLFNFAKAFLLGIFVPSENRTSKKEPPTTSELVAVLTSRKMLAFLGEILVFGMAIGVVERLLFVYVVDTLHGSSLLCGLVVFVSSAFNIPVFQCSGRLLDYFGKDYLMLISQFCYFTRVCGYTLLTPRTKYYILLLETLHGFTFAALWIAAVERARGLAPKGWESTTQSLLQTTYYALGPGLGALLGGYLWHVKNARFMYRAFAAAVAVLFCLRAFVLFCCHCCSRTQGKTDGRYEPLIVEEEKENAVV